MARTHAITLGAVLALVASAAPGVADTATPTLPAVAPAAVAAPTSTVLEVKLHPAAGVAGSQLVNFAVPMPKGLLFDPDEVRVLSRGTELPAARRELALHPDGSVRSVQLQVTTEVSDGAVLQVRLGESPTTAAQPLVDVASTLARADGTAGPRVWVRLPARWLSATGVTGPQVTAASVEGTELDVFDTVCDYDRYGVDAFLPLQGNKDVWLYDRGTALYRGYARQGDLSSLQSAYRETAMYRNQISGADAATRIAVPSAVNDVKYHYAQNLAIHYLLTGDDRFRESAEDIAARVYELWRDPGYAGGADFWTERNAGFSLLAYVWARIVTDDEAALLDQRADEAANAYLAVQNTFPASWTDRAARCFAHTAEAHGESYGTWGCSPWMSAILADALDQYATEREGTAAATSAREAIVRLGTILARDGRDAEGKPFYWMGVGSARDEVDGYDEHWGEPAYVIAMAYFHGGKQDPSLRATALELLTGLQQHGSVPHLRSFNWQCRSAVAAPYYLK